MADPGPVPPVPPRWRTRQLAGAILVAFVVGLVVAPSGDEATVADLRTAEEAVASREADLAELAATVATLEGDLAGRDEDLAAREVELTAALAAGRADVVDEVEPAPEPEPEEPAAPPASAGWTVVHVVDGDTVDVTGPDGAEERVRVIGIDTPERGECGFGPATSAMAAMVLDREVALVAGARDDRDRYDRVLRYVDVDGVDAGLSLIEDGLATARYDSRDGYGRHPREDAYVAAAAATDLTCAPDDGQAPDVPAEAPAPAAGMPFENCAAARAAGAAPVRRGDPGYGTHLDGDGDGIGCE